MAEQRLREFLLEQAIRAVETGGEASVRVRDLADECGVTTPVLYRHFGSREGLIVAVQATRYRRSHLEVFEMFDPVTAAVGSPEEGRVLLRNFLQWVYGPERAPFRLMRASVIGSAVSRPELADAIRDADTEFVHRFANLLRPFQERGWIRFDLSLEAFAIWYLGQLDGRIHLELSSLDVDPEAWNQTSLWAIEWVLFGADSRAR